jgi:chromosome partitioning protein
MDHTAPRESAKGHVLPLGKIEPIGYVVLRRSVRVDRPVKAFDRWTERIPSTYSVAVLDHPSSDRNMTIDTDGICIAKLKRR